MSGILPTPTLETARLILAPPTMADEPAYARHFGPAGFETLVFSNALGNVRSRRIKEKSGARLLRCEPDEFGNPEYTESEIWELTRPEWEAGTGRAYLVPT